MFCFRLVSFLFNTQIHPEPAVAESRHEITGAAVGITGNNSNETANEPAAHFHRNQAFVIDLQPRENPTVLELGDLRELSIASMVCFVISSFRTSDMRTS